MSKKADKVSVPNLGHYKPFEDLIGKNFGDWKVTSFAGRKDSKRFWACECICGEKRDVVETGLIYNRSKSCGCQNMRRWKAAATRHGMTETTEYMSWKCMKARCYIPGTPSYPRYGGKGIKVCERWLNSFENFIEDMGMKPTPQHTLHRKKNKLDYTPENCVWATKKEQQKWRECTRFVTLNGITKCVVEWCEELGLNSGTVNGRLKDGMSGEEAMTSRIFWHFKHDKLVLRAA